MYFDLLAKGRSECLNIVSHFNGIPASSAMTTDRNHREPSAQFISPELMSESAIAYSHSEDFMAYVASREHTANGSFTFRPSIFYT